MSNVIVMQLVYRQLIIKPEDGSYNIYGANGHRIASAVDLASAKKCIDFQWQHCPPMESELVVR